MFEAEWDAAEEWAAAEELDDLLDANPDWAGPLHDAVRGDRIDAWKYIPAVGEPCFVCIYGTLALLRGVPMEQSTSRLPGESMGEFWQRRALLVGEVTALRIREGDGTANVTPLERMIAHVKPGGGPRSHAERAWLDGRIADWKARNAK